MNDEVTEPNHSLAPAKSTLLRLPLASIVPCETNPRRSMHKEPLAELKKSIASCGLIQAISVRPVAGPEGPYEIVAGHRRFQAVSELHKENPDDARFASIEAIVKEVDDAALPALQLIENLNREGLSPLEVADGVAQALEAIGGNGGNGGKVDKLAKQLGWQPRRVYRALELHKAPAWLKKLAVEVRITDSGDAAGATANDVETLPGLDGHNTYELLGLYKALHKEDEEQFGKKGDKHTARAERTVLVIARKAAKEQWSNARLRAAIKQAKEPPGTKKQATPPSPPSPATTSKQTAFEVTDKRVAIDIERIGALTSAQREQLAHELAKKLRELGFDASIRTAPL